MKDRGAPFFREPLAVEPRPLSFHTHGVFSVSGGKRGIFPH